jgi:predicted nucleic acid-binding protein
MDSTATTTHIAITDANVFIDLIEIDTLPLLFELPYTIHTTTFVIDELIDIQKEQVNKYVNNNLLNVRGFDSTQVAHLQQVATQYRKLSETDVSVLVYAREINGTLLTSDNPLRKAAQKMNLCVHGMLWLLDEWVTLELLSPTQAATHLVYLMGVNMRLPTAECVQLLGKWEAITK